MNWVGGVRRRVLQREELKRRQGIFFAAHAVHKPTVANGTADGQQGTSRTGYITVGPHANRSRISPRRWKRDEMVCEKLRRGQAWDSYSRYMHKEYPLQKQKGGSADNHSADTWPAKEEHNRAAKRPSKGILVRPASIHGPFSRYLLRLELQSVGLKLEEGEKKQSSSEKHRFGQSRTREQRKERGSDDTASDLSRNEGKGSVSTGYQENNTRNPSEEPQDARTRKKCTSSTNVNNHKPSYESTQSKSPKDHDEGNITTASKGHQEKEGSKITGKENMHSCMKTPERIHGSTESNTGMQTMTNYPNGQANSSSETSGRKEDSDDRSSEHHNTTGNTERHTLYNNKSQSGISTRTRGKKDHSSRSTSKRKYCNTTVNADDFHESCVSVSTKSRGRKDKSTNSPINREYHSNTVNTKDTTTETTYIRGPKADINPNKTNKTSKKSDRKHQEEESSKRARKRESADKERSHSKKRHRGSDLLAGAPRIRQVLSLSPEHHKGRIWAPLSLSSDSSEVKTKPKEATQSSLHKKQVQSKNFDLVNTEEVSSKGGSENKNKKNRQPGERSRALCRTGRNRHQEEWEDARLAMLLGLQVKDISDSEKDRPKDAQGRHSNGTSDCQLKQRSLKLLPAEHKSRQTATKDHISGDLLASKHMRDRAPEATKNKVHESDHLDTRRPKLSTFTRKIYKVESGLSFARERKDKTPYVDRSFGTPWLGSALINTPGSSLSSSKTPTDPTLERSCEDPFGSQGTELHTNTSTPLQNNVSAQNQEHRKKTTEMEANTAEVNVNMNQNHLSSAQYASEVHCSSPSTIQNSEGLEHRRKWVASNNYNELVPDVLQFLACPLSDENKHVGPTYPEPIYSQCHGTHTNHTSPPQQQYITQEGHYADKISFGFKSMDLFPDDLSQITHTKEVLLGRKHNPDSSDFSVSHTSNNMYISQTSDWGQFSNSGDQTQITTENGGPFHSYVEIQSDCSGDLHSENSKQHALNMPMYHFMAQDYDTNQDAVYSPYSVVNMPKDQY